MRYRVTRQKAEYVPVEVSIECQTGEELVELFWRLAICNRELHAVLRDRGIDPRISSTSSNLSGITQLRLKISGVMNSFGLVPEDGGQ